MLEITIQLDERILENAVGKAWVQLLSSNEGYNREGGGGYVEILRQTKAYIQALDLSAEIAKASRACLSSAVDKIVTQALQDEIKKRTKEMIKAGTLFPKED